MQSLYYNSFFHFERISFLKENNIDFFEPYYADFEGMTEAMCRAKRMVVVDKALYALTENTSQTLSTKFEIHLIHMPTNRLVLLFIGWFS